MADNSYAQLIDDYENGILVEPGETLTQYIDRMGGVDYKADGGSIGIEVLFQPKREEYQTGGRTFDSRATTQDYTNALQSVSAGTTGQQQADARRYARNQAAQMLNEAARAKPQARGIENIYNTFFKNQNVTGIGPNTFGRSGSGTNPDALMYYRSADRDKILDAMANQMLNTTSYAPPTDSLTGMLESQMLPNMADGSMKSLAEQNAIRDRVLAAQKAQEESYYLTDPISGKKYTSQDEAINDLGLVTYNQRFADGGRVGLFMGGDPLTGQALSVYESMNAYGFTDQQIANALRAQGLYDAAPVVETPVINKAPNIINNQGDGGGGGNTITFSDPNFNLGPNKDVVDYEADAYGIGPTFRGQLAKAYIGLKSLPTPFNIASRTLGNITDFAKAQAKKAAEALAAAKSRAESRRQYDSSVHGPVNYGLGSDGKQSYDSGQGFGVNATTGGPVSNRSGRGRTDYKDGGLATLFNKKR